MANFITIAQEYFDVEISPDRLFDEIVREKVEPRLPTTQSDDGRQIKAVESEYEMPKLLQLRLKGSDL